MDKTGGSWSAKNGRLHVLSDCNHSAGLCYAAALPDDAPDGDDIKKENRSGLRVFENGVELGPAHSNHEEIRTAGGGRFSHWGRSLLFSASDGSDPKTNGKSYAILYSRVDDPLRAMLTECLNVDDQSLTREERYLWGERAFNAFVSDARLSEFGRTMFADTEFLADYERFDNQNYRSFDRKFALRELLKLALPLDGELAECGIFRGATAYLMAKAMSKASPTRRLHLFDSFEGVSEPQQEVDGGYWKAGALACSLAEVAARLRRYEHVIQFHPGWIPERFAEVADQRFCLVHVDVDLYQPTRDSLAFFGPRISPGGLIVCDDYGFETCPGARKAVDEFAAGAKMPVIHLPTGQSALFFGR